MRPFSFAERHRSLGLGIVQVGLPVQAAHAGAISNGELALSLQRQNRVPLSTYPAATMPLLAMSAALVSSLALPGHVLAQAKSQPSQVAQQQVTVQGPGMPDPYRMSMLIRTTLIALSQANLTGNYTVLRDLGSPAFQAVNSAARLTEAFADLRQRRLDFSPILFFDPKLVRQPALDEAGRLRLRGFIETRPEQINFDILFENVGGDWRLFGLAVQMQPMPAAPAATSQQQSPSAKSGSAPDKSKQTAREPAAPTKK